MPSVDPADRYDDAVRQAKLAQFRARRTKDIADMQASSEGWETLTRATLKTGLPDVVIRLHKIARDSRNDQAAVSACRAFIMLCAQYSISKDDPLADLVAAMSKNIDDELNELRKELPE